MSSSSRPPIDPPPASRGARPRVRPLESALVDQIAAGEVVERPASVVKELIENAIDAGARSLRVETEQGGAARILVADDGCGMDREDAIQAMARHATSKIRTLDDLLRVRTLGFRGEALPSIASVSRFSLVTRPHDALEATELLVEGGGPLQARVVGAGPGTSVRVDDLFFNVPARRKFLKRIETESAHIGETLIRFALAMPELRIAWLRDGRRARDFAPAHDFYERAYQLFAGERLAAIEGERDGVRVRAVLGTPDRARRGGAQLHASVNGRIVRDRALARAVAFAYGDSLPQGRFPIGVVSVELDAERLDVNVHPQKAEVRFAEARVVFEAITRILAAGLGERPFGVHRPPVGARLPSPPDRPPPDRPPPDRPPPDRPLPDRPLPDRSLPERPSPHHVAERFDPSAYQRSSQSRLLAELRSRWLVCERADGVLFLDRRALDAWCLTARLALEHRDGEIEARRLLIPERLTLPERALHALEAQAPLLASLGIDVRVFGDREALVATLPARARRASPERLVRAVLAALLGDERAAEGGDAIDAALLAIGREAAIPIGEAATDDERRAWLEALDGPLASPEALRRARVVARSVSFDDLARSAEAP